MPTVTTKPVSGVLDRTIQHCRELKVVLPTFAQMVDPSLVQPEVARTLASVGLDDVHPHNLFRITWKNDLKTGLFGGVNTLEIPGELTGVKTRIVGLVGKRFPTGAHKVGAAYGCLAPRLVGGEFDPTRQKAVWPSTGNYCRGGAFDSALLRCTAVAILPEGMSRERFEWLTSIGAEIVRTPGTESNVKEIYDKCWEIRKTRKDCLIFNQFEEFGNPVWHYHVTGSAIEEAFLGLSHIGGRLAAFVSATGSAGTIGAGDYLKGKFPECRVVAAEAQQCPTLFLNGYGSHRIEGIGDKHVPWIHNVRNTDILADIDDEDCMRLLRLFNEPAGIKFLGSRKIPRETVESLSLLGISGICNLLASIKTAKLRRLKNRDFIFTVFTDSAELYRSRLKELRKERGEYTAAQAAEDFEQVLLGQSTNWTKELDLQDRRAIHNLKYFTWVEQQGKTVEELDRLWEPRFWSETFAQAEDWGKKIDAFNHRTGVLRSLRG